MQEIEGIGLVIHDLVDGNSQYIDDYLAIYNELFPQYIRYAPVMRRRAEQVVDAFADEKWHQWLLVIHGKPVGIIGFLYNRKRNVGILMDFAIRPAWRNVQHKEFSSLANLALLLAMRQLVQDALGSGYPAPLCMAAEVEHTALLQKYFEYGYVEFPVEYYEPPYTPELAEVFGDKDKLDKIAFGKMYLGAFQIPGHPFNPKNPDIIKAVLFALLVDHYSLPVDHWLFLKITQETPDWKDDLKS